MVRWVKLGLLEFRYFGVTRFAGFRVVVCLDGDMVAFWMLILC